MNYKVSTANSIRYIGFEALDSAINWAVNHGNAVVVDCVNDCIIATTHKFNGSVYIHRLINGRMMQNDAILLRQRELGNIPLLHGDTSLEMMGWQDIS